MGGEALLDRLVGYVDEEEHDPCESAEGEVDEETWTE